MSGVQLLRPSLYLQTTVHYLHVGLPCGGRVVERIHKSYTQGWLNDFPLPHQSPEQIMHVYGLAHWPAVMRGQWPIMMLMTSSLGTSIHPSQHEVSQQTRCRIIFTNAIAVKDIIGQDSSPLQQKIAYYTHRKFLNLLTFWTVEENSPGASFFLTKLSREID